MSISSTRPSLSRTARFRRAILAVGIGLAGTGNVAVVRAAAQAAGAQQAGTWDLSFEKGNRRCRINLLADAAGSGYAIAMPAGCHRAFPSLGVVKSWVSGEGQHIVFETEAGQPVLDFGPTGGPSLSAAASEEDTYLLTPTSTERQAAVAAAGLAQAAAPAAAADITRPAVPGDQAAAATLAVKASTGRPVSVAEVAGYYAVLRQGRDTGCMVTLDGKVAGPKGSLKAKLAPACRDQGIVIFDPAGWHLARNEVILTAKRGHSTALVLQDDGTWSNASGGGRALVLKRL